MTRALPPCGACSVWPILRFVCHVEIRQRTVWVASAESDGTQGIIDLVSSPRCAARLLLRRERCPCLLSPLPQTLECEQCQRLGLSSGGLGSTSCTSCCDAYARGAAGATAAAGSCDAAAPSGAALTVRFKQSLYASKNSAHTTDLFSKFFSEHDSDALDSGSHGCGRRRGAAVAELGAWVRGQRRSVADFWRQMPKSPASDSTSSSDTMTHMRFEGAHGDEDARSGRWWLQHQSVWSDATARGRSP